MIVRIIPADAGSTPKESPIAMMFGDHPRGCGEHDAVETGKRHFHGSSPRMRGAPVIADTMRAFTRIIPADAGSTICCNVRNFTFEDHPRGCGEHYVAGGK